MWPFSRKPKQPPVADAASHRPAPACDSCEERATFHLTWAESGGAVREKHLCENHARSVPTAYALGDYVLFPACEDGNGHSRVL